MVRLCLAGGAIYIFYRLCLAGGAIYIFYRLCLAGGAIYIFVSSLLSWWCHFDDDNYVNVLALATLLKR